MGKPKRSYERMERFLTSIKDFKPKEIVYDEFAYKRMVESYRQAAKDGLKSLRKIGEES